QGRAGRVRGGDRLPWVPLREGADNFAALDGKSWQVHVYGEASEAVWAACRIRSLPLHVCSWTEAAAQAGLKRNAAYVIRPDGYVGYAQTSSETLESYLK